ncbi:hypothetical protein H1P_2880006 [Hyella patelloides LEGE 07179]|uniref:Uncharacterized protein n=1 Tax=Hyella patelloides LEGE 07179 TaxID=945734 RepID=A0A563VTP1_9CYAN|nr:hypothetical protein H1P_2880006 [Hyella patelloides LEGE 07179]
MVSLQKTELICFKFNTYSLVSIVIIKDFMTLDHKILTIYSYSNNQDCFLETTLCFQYCQSCFDTLSKL